MTEPVLSQFSADAPSMSSGSTSFPLVARLWRDLLKEFADSYRPELHYMRGPGPRWRERHAAATAQANVLNGTIAESRTQDVPLPPGPQAAGLLPGTGRPSGAATMT